MAGDQDAKLRRRLETFRTVAQERLDRLNLGWIQFEQAPGTATPTAFLREIHTLKGEAGLTGFASVIGLLHRLEDLVQARCQSGRPPEPSAGDLVMRGLDLAATVVKRPPESESADINAFLAELPRPEPKRAGTPPLRPPPARPGPALAAPTAAALPSTPSQRRPRAAGPRPSRRPGAARAVRLTSEKLDGLRDLVAELLLTRVRLERSAAELRNAKETALELRRSPALPDESPQPRDGPAGRALLRAGVPPARRGPPGQPAGQQPRLRHPRPAHGAARLLLDRYPMAVRALLGSWASRCSCAPKARRPRSTGRCWNGWTSRCCT